MVIVGSFGVMLPSPIVEKGKTLRRNVYKECDYFTQSLHVHDGSPESNPKSTTWVFILPCTSNLPLPLVFTMELVNLLPEAGLSGQCSIVGFGRP